MPPAATHSRTPRFARGDAEYQAHIVDLDEGISQGRSMYPYRGSRRSEPTGTYMSLLQSDAENSATEDEDNQFDNVVSARSRLKLRFGMVVAAVALVAGAIAVTKWSPLQGGVQRPGQQSQAQHTVAKWVDPCAMVTPATFAPAPATFAPPATTPGATTVGATTAGATTAGATTAVVTTAAPTPATLAPGGSLANPCALPSPDACTPFGGIFNAATKSCCFKSCGTFCGATNCKLAPVGAMNCCPDRFAFVCGSSHFGKAPCQMPVVKGSAIQLILEPLGEFISNPLALKAVKTALARILGIPEKYIEVALAPVPGAGGRRLLSAVNVNYVLNLPRNTTIPADATFSAKSVAFEAELRQELAHHGLPVTVQRAVVLPPVEIHPFTKPTGEVTSTTPVRPTLPIPPTTPTTSATTTLAATTPATTAAATTTTEESEPEPM